jgi:hypothetical protein
LRTAAKSATFIFASISSPIDRSHFTTKLTSFFGT